MRNDVEFEIDCRCRVFVEEDVHHCLDIGLLITGCFMDEDEDEDDDDDDDDDDDGYFHERLPVHGQVMVGFPAHSAVDTGGYIFRGF